ncbi:MAG: hypothetical protein WA005_08355 [Candidatus Binataceae bacterium]
MKDRPATKVLVAALLVMLAAAMLPAAARAASTPEVIDRRGGEVGLFYFMPIFYRAVPIVIPVHDVLGELQARWYAYGVALPPLTDGAVRKIDGRLFALPVSRDGFDSTSFLLEFQTANCSGKPFFNALSDPLLVTPADGYLAGVFKHTLYFGKGPAQKASFGSVAFVDDPTKPVTADQCGTCPSGGCGTVTIEPLESFDLSTLDLVPPFHLSQ